MTARVGVWAAALLAVVALHGASVAWSAVPVSLEEAPERVGERVVVGGRVREVHRWGDAGVLEVTDGRVVLGVRVEGDVPRVASGDTVEAVGVVGSWRGRVEVRARAVDVAVVARSHDPVEVGDVAGDPGRFRGTPVAVRGVLAETPVGWRLEDGEASIGLVGERSAGWRDGMPGVAQGVVAYDGDRARFVVEVASWRSR